MTIEDIKAIIKKEEYNSYGIRADLEGLEIGHEFENSRQWWQDDPEDGSEYNEVMQCWDGGELNGVCTVGIDPWYVIVKDDSEVIEKALERAATYATSGKGLYLVGGDWSEGGNDIGEEIIHDGKCLAVIK